MRERHTWHDTITKLLLNALLEHLKESGVEYFISGNGLTFFSCSGERTMKERLILTLVVYLKDKNFLCKKVMSTC